MTKLDQVLQQREMMIREYRRSTWPWRRRKLLRNTLAVVLIAAAWWTWLFGGSGHRRLPFGKTAMVSAGVAA